MMMKIIRKNNNKTTLIIIVESTPTLHYYTTNKTTTTGSHTMKSYPGQLAKIHHYLAPSCTPKTPHLKKSDIHRTK